MNNEPNSEPEREPPDDWNHDDDEDGLWTPEIEDARAKIARAWPRLAEPDDDIPPTAERSS